MNAEKNEDSVAVYRNDYPLLARKEPLSSAGVMMETLIISRIKSCGEQLDEVTIPRSLIESHGIGKGDHYARAIQDVIDELLSYKVKVKISEHETVYTNIVSRFTLHEITGTLTVSVDKYLTPYLVNLQGRFTMVETSLITGLSGQYARKFYLTLKPYEFVGELAISVIDLKESLGLGSLKTYAKYKDFNRFILTPSIKQLNEESDIKVEIMYEKNGRAISGFMFKISKNKMYTPSLFPQDSIKNIPIDLMEYFSEIGYRDLHFMSELIIEHGEDKINKSINIFKEILNKDKKIKNKGGFLRTQIMMLINLANVKEEEVKVLNSEEKTTKKLKEQDKVNREERSALVTAYIEKHRDELIAVVDPENKWGEAGRESLIRLEAMKRISE